MSDLPEENEEAKAPEKGGNKTIVIILISVIALLIVAIVILFFTPFGKRLLGTDDKSNEAKQEEKIVEEKIDPSKIAFVNMPEVLITLRSKEGKGGFLKASFVVQAANEEVAHKIDKLKPIILDQIQVYLRELDLEDMRGSAGLQRVRQDLTARVNNILAPDKTLGVLIKDFILQ